MFAYYSHHVIHITWPTPRMAYFRVQAAAVSDTPQLYKSRMSGLYCGTVHYTTVMGNTAKKLFSKPSDLAAVYIKLKLWIIESSQIANSQSSVTEIMRFLFAFFHHDFRAQHTPFHSHPSPFPLASPTLPIVLTTFASFSTFSGLHCVESRNSQSVELGTKIIMVENSQSQVPNLGSWDGVMDNAAQNYNSACVHSSRDSLFCQNAVVHVCSVFSSIFVPFVDIFVISSCVTLHIWSNVRVGVTE